jgi:hypothetical protein
VTGIIEGNDTIVEKRGARVIEKALEQSGLFFLLKPKSFGIWLGAN